ncbi:D-alanyl-D-alanine carboxypeptidase-like protein [Deinococcus yavapaiensis KR-236]|uniref:D-alanyl-D-alanine carboxypeptidase-like protein n=2 Tax=Deinococcus TaxID=1298 RepID=A0A318RZQ5_9DEIO|nr:D-alanyl-D-alanine carboxypeptidase-like protein [Deinococcus yavapaiensis KR-236]
MVLVGAAILVAYHDESSAAPSPAPSSITAPPLSPRPPARLSGEEDGVVPPGVTIFEDEYPAVAKLSPDLRRALRSAAADASKDGVTLLVKSGWRSRAYQNELLREAVSKYGSVARAARWVATADTSPHVSGDAVDVGPSSAAAWLAKHGATYGLCQIYRNEPWHYELRLQATDRGCPPLYADPTRDPRMH